MRDPRLLILPVMFGVVYSIFIHSQSRQEKGIQPRGRIPLYTPRYGTYFILFLPYIFRAFFISFGIEEPFLWCVANVLILSVGFGLLLLLFPVLRKLLKAESCANLWSIPCFIFLFTGLSPCWSITLPVFPGRQQVGMLGWIWFAGFATVILWSILSHLLFRHRLLKNAKPVKDEQYLQLWQKKLYVVNLPAGKIRFCISPDAETPLSVGLFWRTTCLVLPVKAYSPEELSLVLQHELIHICRRDSLHKLTMCILAAFMWFNPLVWIALRVCAQDLELSCDEAVLYGRPKETRMEYARLLLQTAPKAKGFTSCLSSAASSLRYRLKHVVNERKRIVGSVLVGLLCCLMLLGSMCTGVRYKAMPAKELLFAESEIEQLEVREVFLIVDGEDLDGECKDARRLLDYIAALSLRQTSERPDVFAGPNHAQILICDSAHKYSLNLGGGYLRVYTVEVPLPGEETVQRTMTYYQLDSEPDWELLRACTTP